VNNTKTYRSLIYGPLLVRVRQALEACEKRGRFYWLTSGLRSYAEQGALYALGRTVANVDATPEKPLGNVVTRAKPGESFHNFGLAVDVALDGNTTRAGLQPDWRPEAYAVWGEEAARAGLEWGGTWRSFQDFPHVQWPGVSLADCRREFAAGGLPAVWLWLDRSRP
jgi:peptidoglycan L-alanyl-D-glutamate endopeptidase CwlK